MLFCFFFSHQRLVHPPKFLLKSLLSRYGLGIDLIVLVELYNSSTLGWSITKSDISDIPTPKEELQGRQMFHDSKDKQ